MTTPVGSGRFNCARWSTARRIAMVAAVILAVTQGSLHANWLPTLVIIRYDLVSSTPRPDGVEYVFRANLLNLGPAIPGAVARLVGASEAATILDDTLSFGPIGHLGAAWSTDSAAIVRHGRWIDVVSDLRWSIQVGPVNRPPVADAGTDRTAHVFDRIVLDGSGSVDPEGDALTYRWLWVDRPAASAADLSDPSAVRPEFTIDVPGRYVLSLTVHDGTQWSSPDVVEVSTENARPVAHAGDDRTVAVDSVVQLDGSGSSDADGDPLAFAWRLVDAPPASAAALDNPATVRPTLRIDAPGAYVLELIVHDGQTASLPDTVVLRTDNSPPVADAGTDQTAPVGQTVTLDGSGSTDLDGDSLQYAWSLVARPVGGTATLQNAETPAPSFVVDLPGTYVAQLIVNDGSLDSLPDTVVISTENSAPIANAGTDQTAVAGQVVVIDGSGSSDPDGNALSFRWMLTAMPAGSTASIADATAAVTSIVVDRPGEYAVQLIVNDGQLDSAPDTAVVSTTNSVPVANAGPDQTDVPLHSVVTLDGSASSDADGHALTYSWSLLSRPAGSGASLTDGETVAPSFTVDVVGDYIAQLIVNDGVGGSAPDTVRVSVANAPPVADAGPDQRVALTAVVQLDGSASSDPEGMPLTFSWSFVSQPAGSSATLSDPADREPTFVADRPGLYVVQLIVSDGVHASAPDLVLVTADAPVVSVDATDSSAAEAGPDAGTFTLTRTGLLATPLVVEIALGGSAANGTDYTAIGSTVTFASGEATTLVTVTPIQDILTEGDEAVVLHVVDGGQYDVGTPATASLTIADDPPTVVTIVATDDSSSEAGDTGTFTISRTGTLTSPIVVNLTITGTATPGVDYATLPATVTFAAGAASATLTVVPTDDGDPEPVEHLVVELSAGSGYVVGSPLAASVSIADDDTRVSVVATDAVASENGPDTGTYTLTRQGPLDSPLTVSYTIAGTATAGFDFVPLPGSATFPAGADETVVTLTPIDDTLLEGPESVELRLGPGAGYQVGALANATLTIQDDERPAVTLVTTDSSASEAGPDMGTFTISRTGPTTSALVVSFSLSGSATEGADYEGLGGSVTIPAGAASATVTITPIDDSLVEGAEHVVLSISPAPDYSPVIPSIAALTIADDDLGVVSIVATDPAASELGPDPATFTISRTGDTAAPLTVFVAANGTVFDTDYEPIGTIVTIPAGLAAVTITIMPRADNLVEGAEDLTLTISPNLAYVVGSPASASVTIADDPAVVSVGGDPDAAEAGLEPGAFVLTRNGGSLASAMSVSVGIGGTATANRDYAVFSGVVTFPAGQATVVVPVTPLPDNIVEGDETVVLTLNPGTGTVYLVGTPSNATVTIADDPVIVTLAAADADAAEAGLDPGTVTVTRAGGDVAEALNVFFTKGGTASNGADYQNLGGGVSLVVIPAGQFSNVVTIAPVADNLVESPETAVLTLAANAAYVIGSSPSAAVTITDDPPVVNVTATDPDASEAGSDPGTLTFTRSGGNLAGSLTVSFTRTGTATNVSDFVTIPSSVTFAPGLASVTLTITPIDDAAVEGPETVIVTVNGSSTVVPGPSATALVTIADNE